MSLPNPILKILAGLTALVAVLFSTACISVETHSTIEPIYLTLDVNLKVELQKELDNVFADLDAISEAVEE
jgi:hypothetical protein